MTYRSLLVCLALLLAMGTLAQQRQKVHGAVLDGNGLPIGEAEVEFRSASGTARARTTSNGEFAFDDAAVPGTLIVRRAGFSPVTLTINADSAAGAIQIHMNPAAAIERIEVSANGDDRIPPTPVSQYSLSSDVINDSGALALDDVLRQAPGFTLFRRSGSLFANPTTQGVSLRGVGANGASRANVLLDGIPLNDPFGGWVYWEQVPVESISNVTVTNGGASDTYGGGALGGVVNLESRPVQNSFAAVEMSYGNENTPSLSFDAGTVIGKWGISASG